MQTCLNKSRRIWKLDAASLQATTFALFKREIIASLKVYLFLASIASVFEKAQLLLKK
jgi:hypothetical protein